MLILTRRKGEGVVVRDVKNNNDILLIKIVDFNGARQVRVGFEEASEDGNIHYEVRREELPPRKGRP